jgi:branched-chain amino acid transport system permease protein
MQVFIQQVVNGIGQGALIALFAVGFGLIFSKLGILNVAHGSFATWGAVISYYTYVDLHVSVILCVVLGTIGAGVAGMLVDILCFAPLRGRGSGAFGSLITSVGAWIIALSLAQTIIGPNANGFPAGAAPSGIITISGIIVLPMVLIDVIVAVVLGVGVWALVRLTPFGASLRTIGHDPRSAAIVGINPKVVILWTAFIAAALAGLAGALAALTNNTITYNVGDGLLVVGFAAVVIGGVGSVSGAILGGFGLGLVQVLSAQYISSSFRDAITYGVLLTILMIRPQGFFRETIVSRA